MQLIETDYIYIGNRKIRSRENRPATHYNACTGWPKK